MSYGWNIEKVGEITDICSEIYDLHYELDNCIRGCYSKCNTYKELAEYVKHLAYELIDAAENMDTTEDPEDEY